jgi:flagellar assembly factor FliW
MATAAGTILTVQTRFGAFPADAADIVAMVEGLAGFEHCRRFVLLTSTAIAPLTCVQGLDEPRPSFLAVAVRLVDPHYPEGLSLGDRLRLDAAQEEPLLWMAFVTLVGDVATVNLRAPVVINPRRMLGLQVIAAESAYVVDHPLSLD